MKKKKSEKQSNGDKGKKGKRKDQEAGVRERRGENMKCSDKDGRGRKGRKIKWSRQ